MYVFYPDFAFNLNSSATVMTSWNSCKTHTICHSKSLLCDLKCCNFHRFCGGTWLTHQPLRLIILVVVLLLFRCLFLFPACVSGSFHCFWGCFLLHFPFIGYSWVFLILGLRCVLLWPKTVTTGSIGCF